MALFTLAQCDEILEKLRLAALELASGKPYVSFHGGANGEQIRVDADCINKQISFWKEQREEALTDESCGAIALVRRRAG